MARRKRRSSYREVSHDPHKITAAMKRETGTYMPGRFERDPRARSVTVKVSINRQHYSNHGNLTGKYTARACIQKKGALAHVCARGHDETTPTRALQSALRTLSSSISNRRVIRSQMRRQAKRKSKG